MSLTGASVWGGPCVGLDTGVGNGSGLGFGLGGGELVAQRGAAETLAAVGHREDIGRRRGLDADGRDVEVVSP